MPGTEDALWGTVVFLGRRKRSLIVEGACSLRGRADDWRDAANVQELHTLCHRLIAERETLASALESLRRTLANVDIEYRLENLGQAARRKNRMAKAALDTTREAD